MGTVLLSVCIDSYFDSNGIAASHAEQWTLLSYVLGVLQVQGKGNCFDDASQLSGSSVAVAQDFVHTSTCPGMP